MGHHPPTGAQQVAEVATTGNGISPTTWIIILIGAGLAVYIVYKLLQKK